MNKLESVQLQAYYAHRVNIHRIAKEHLEQAMTDIKAAGALVLNGGLDMTLAMDTVTGLMSELSKLITDDSTALEQLTEAEYD